MTDSHVHSGTVLFQPPNKVGLGHISRLSAVARALAGIGEFRTPFVIDSGSDLLLDVLQLPYLAIPNRRRIEVIDCWKPWRAEDRKGIVKAVCKAVVEQLSPDLVVFDCIPHGDFALQCLRRKIPLALCLRPVRDMQDYLARYGDLLRFYNLIIVPDYQIDPILGESAELRKRTFCVGPIARIQPRNVTPSALKTSHSKRVVISGGGGGFPGTVDFYNLAGRAVRTLRRRLPDLEALLILGPLFAEWDRLELPERMSVLPFTPAPLDYFADSDVVVCQAGYNTALELEMIDTPAVMVPAVRGLDDQFKRARLAAETQPGIRVFESDDHEELARVMEGAIFSPVKRTPKETHEGAARAAEIISDFVQKRRRQSRRMDNTSASLASIGQAVGK